MSSITLSQVKTDLRMTQNYDDALIQTLLDASEDEAIQFMNRTELPTLPVVYPPVYDSNDVLVSEEVPSSGDPVAPSVITAVFLLVRAKYQAETADEVAKLRKCAETLLMPFRAQMGV